MERTIDEIAKWKGRPTAIVWKQTGSGDDPGKGVIIDEMRELQGSFPVSGDRKSNKRLCTSVDESDRLSSRLLPGIPDDITMSQIVPKMQWRVFHSLSLVNHCWHQAIQSHQVRDARARSQSQDTFLVIHSPPDNQFILYSVRDKYHYKLPQIPNRQLGDAERRGWIALDGRLYVFGGLYDADKKKCGSREVYVLDLAGQREWKQCASMEKGRLDLGCVVRDEKIYAFGGSDGGYPVCGHEVYDPKHDSWSRISSRKCFQWSDDEAVLVEEDPLYNRRPYGPEHLPADTCNCDGSIVRPPRHPTGFFKDVTAFFKNCHPLAQSWLKMPRESYVEHRWMQRLFRSKGNLYRMVHDEPIIYFNDDPDVSIDVYDYDKRTWSQLRSFSLGHVAGKPPSPSVYDVIVVNGELLVAAFNCVEGESDFFLRSNGFGTDRVEIEWTIENGSLSIREYSFLCTVQL